MKARGVDFILCPTYAGAGVLQGEAKYWGYSSIWNILDLPAAVVPSGLRCDKAVDVREDGYTPRGQKDEQEWKACKWRCECCFPCLRVAAGFPASQRLTYFFITDDPELFHGFPIALQLVGKRFRDEDVLAAAKVLDAALKSDN